MSLGSRINAMFSQIARHDQVEALKAQQQAALQRNEQLISDIRQQASEIRSTVSDTLERIGRNERHGRD